MHMQAPVPTAIIRLSSSSPIVAALAPAPAGGISADVLALLEPSHWTFDIDGDVCANRYIDGYIHQSGRRRAYAECPYHKDEGCWMYVFIITLDQPLCAIAHCLFPW